jgi:predicted component of type VI protein secretion system
MAVTAAAAVATLKKLMNMRKVLRRLISPAEIAEKLAFWGDLYKYVNSWGCDTLSKQFVL